MEQRFGRRVGCLVAIPQAALEAGTCPFEPPRVAPSQQVVNRVLRCRWLRRPALRVLATVTIPVVAALLVLFVVSSAVDVRSFV